MNNYNNLVTWLFSINFLYIFEFLPGSIPHLWAPFVFDISLCLIFVFWLHLHFNIVYPKHSFFFSFEETIIALSTASGNFLHFPFPDFVCSPQSMYMQYSWILFTVCVLLPDLGTIACKSGNHEFFYAWPHR